MDTTPTLDAVPPLPDHMLLRLSVGRLLGQSFRIYLRNFVPFVLLSAVVHLPSLLVSLSGSRVAASLNIGLSLVLTNIAGGAMTYGVFQQLRGRPVGVGLSLVMGLKRLFPVLGVGLLTSIAVSLGYLALWIPGIFLSCMLYVAVPAAVVERPGVLGALKRSRDLTAGFKGTIFGAQFLIGIVAIVTTIVVGIALGAGGVVRSQGSASMVVFLWLAGLVVGAWGSVSTAVAYHDLRLVKEGVGIEELAKVFD